MGPGYQKSAWGQKFWYLLLNNLLPNSSGACRWGIKDALHTAFLLSNDRGTVGNKGRVSQDWVLKTLLLWRSQGFNVLLFVYFCSLTNIFLKNVFQINFRLSISKMYFVFSFFKCFYQWNNVRSVLFSLYFTAAIYVHTGTSNMPHFFNTNVSYTHRWSEMVYSFWAPNQSWRQ